jgi:hypothetical protein
VLTLPADELEDVVRSVRRRFNLGRRLLALDRVVLSEEPSPFFSPLVTILLVLNVELGLSRKRSSSEVGGLLSGSIEGAKACEMFVFCGVGMLNLDLTDSESSPTEDCSYSTVVTGLLVVFALGILLLELATFVTIEGSSAFGVEYDPDPEYRFSMGIEERMSGILDAMNEGSTVYCFAENRESRFRK